MKKHSIIIFLSIILFQMNGIAVNIVDTFVNPYIGNISHLLVPTYPTVHLPNSMLRVYPERDDFTGDMLHGLPVIITSHRGRSAFSISPFQGDESQLQPVIRYSYDNEKIKPYGYEVNLDEQQIGVCYAVSHQAAVYEFNFQQNSPIYIILNSNWGKMEVEGSIVKGLQELDNNTRVYLFAEFDCEVIKTGVLRSGKIVQTDKISEGSNAAVALKVSDKAKKVKMRYGVSFISIEQARLNLNREINHFDLEKVKTYGREVWNKALGKIKVTGTDTDALKVFYTSLYRCYERPVCISEDGRYFSAFDGTVHQDEGIPFFTDDWIWDTYRATHPLRLLIDAKVESDILNSFIRMAYQMPDHWMPTFPEITGDSRRMNSNHGVVTIADAIAKGITSFNAEKAYTICKAAITEKTLAPWSAKKAGWIDQFYKDKGYIPALARDEKETVPEVHGWEKRQPVAVTLGTAYDEWSLYRIADAIGKNDDAAYFKQRALNYRNLYNPETAFFHPKDRYGAFIQPFDYRYDGGLGGREYYGENNGWVYRWDVPHNVADLITLMGGNEKFNQNLNQTFREPLGRNKWQFYAELPDHTGNVGQFSMANEPSLHIPYLYNYSGQPWMTQKRIRMLLKQWFRNDLMGMPGDEDGGGMSAFVVFSMLGFYPVTPGLPVYNIGSPVFENAEIVLSGGKIFKIKVKNYATDNTYIQSVKLNGKTCDKPWFTHNDLIKGGELTIVMGNKANHTWGIAVPPPSFQ